MVSGSFASRAGKAMGGFGRCGARRFYRRGYSLQMTNLSSGLADREQVLLLRLSASDRGVSGTSGRFMDHRLNFRTHPASPDRGICYAFDPRRTAILLLGGDKTGKDRFYEEYLRQAGQLYDIYLHELKMEGLI
jgi:hypothetical protein